MVWKGEDTVSTTTGKRAIVIGAGLGGISAASSLVSEGFQVDLIEKNAQIGGKLNLKQRDGYSFDLGPSILILPYLFERLFTQAGKRMEDYVAIEELDVHWRNWFEDGMVVDLTPDMKKMEQELAKFGPKASDGFYSFLDYSRKLWKFCEEAYFDRGADTMREVIRGYSLLEVAKRSDPFATMAKGVARHFKHQHLRDIFNFFIKYVGSSAYDAPAIYNLMAYSQFGYGLWYVTGGMYNLARGFNRLLQDQGVNIHLNTEVLEIKKNGKLVESVVCSDGETREADVIVSNMEVIPAYEKLLQEKGRMMERYEKKYEPSCSGLVIHLGVDKEYPQLAHHNFFFAKNQKKHWDSVYHKHQLPNDPTIYLVAPTRTDKTIAPEGHEIIKILPHIPHLQEPRFTMEDYEALKVRLYQKLERMGLHDLRKHIVVEDMLVPDDLERMYYSNKGSIYGVIADKKKNYGFRAPKRSERYKNLYFVGGSVNPGSGMPMVIYSGQMVRDKILKDMNE